MAQPAIAIIGVARLLKKFDRMSEIDMTPAVNKAVMIVEGSAKAKVAVDKGILRGSITPEVKRSGKNIIGRVFTNIEYAPFVEFGTGAKGDGTYPYNVNGLSLTYRQTPWGFEGGDGEFVWTNGQVAQPFMYPALKQNEKKIKKLLGDEYKALLMKKLK